MLPVTRLKKLKKEWDQFLIFLLLFFCVFGSLLIYIANGSLEEAIGFFVLFLILFSLDIVIANILIKNVIKFRKGAWIGSVIWLIILPLIGMLAVVVVLVRNINLNLIGLLMFTVPIILFLCWGVIIIKNSISVLLGKGTIAVFAEYEKRFQCRNCSTPIQGDVVRCPKCGKKLFACPVCNSITTEDEKKCAFCGSEFE